MYDDYDRIDARIRMAFRDIHIPPPRVPRETFSERNSFAILGIVCAVMWGFVIAGLCYAFR